MITFTAKSDCGKYSFKLEIDEVVDKTTAVVKTPKVTPAVSVPPVAINTDTTVFIPTKFLSKVRDMWPDDLPWELYDIEAEVKVMRKQTGRDSLSASQQVDLHEMHRTNNRINRQRQKCLDEIKAKNMQPTVTPVTDYTLKAADAAPQEPLKQHARALLDKIRQEESEKERAVIAKEGVSLKRLRQQTNQSV